MRDSVASPAPVSAASAIICGARRARGERGRHSSTGDDHHGAEVDTAHARKPEFVERHSPRDEVQPVRGVHRGSDHQGDARPPQLGSCDEQFKRQHRHQDGEEDTHDRARKEAQHSKRDEIGGEHQQKKSMLPDGFPCSWISSNESDEESHCRSDHQDVGRRQEEVSNGNEEKLRRKAGQNCVEQPGPSAKRK